VGFGLVTLHRPSNVNSRNVLAELCDHLVDISKKMSLIFPVHPRTLGKLAEHCGQILNACNCKPGHKPIMQAPRTLQNG